MDIVERLRKVFGVVVKADDCFEEDYSVAREAADEIERLRQQVEELVEVLQKYKCDCHPNCWDDCETYECDCGVNYCGASANRAIAKATGDE